MDDIEYRPQRGIGTRALVRACIAVVVVAIVLSLGFQSRAAFYAAAFPAAGAIAWFTAFQSKRRLRTRLTSQGIESRGLRTRFIPWTEVHDVEVVKRVTVAALPVLGNRTSGRSTTRSGGGARKVAWVRVQLPSGRWRELAMPVAYENAPDPGFTDKADVIKDRWRAATGRVSVG